jgi:hypothetical protein
MTTERNAKSQTIGGAETQARSSVNSSSEALHTRNPKPLHSTTPHTHTFTMASIIGRAAFRATRPLGSENAASAASREADKNALKQGARKDPELYVRRRCLCAFPDTQKDIADNTHNPMLPNHHTLLVLSRKQPAQMTSKEYHIY